LCAALECDRRYSNGASLWFEFAAGLTVRRADASLQDPLSTELGPKLGALGRKFDRPLDRPFPDPLLLLRKPKPSVGVAKKNLPKLWQRRLLCELEASSRALAGLLSGRMMSHGIIPNQPACRFHISLIDFGDVVTAGPAGKAYSS
jgi:hypothetical protein